MRVSIEVIYGSVNSRLFLSNEGEARQVGMRFNARQQLPDTVCPFDGLDFGAGLIIDGTNDRVAFFATEFVEGTTGYHWSEEKISLSNLPVEFEGKQFSKHILRILLSMYE